MAKKVKEVEEVIVVDVEVITEEVVTTEETTPGHSSRAYRQ